MASWPSNSSGVVPASFAIAARAAAPSASCLAISVMVSNQMPASALPRFGLAFSVAVSTTSRSRISPGISAEVKTAVVPGTPFMVVTCGFHATAALIDGAAKAAAMSASEVLTVFTSVIFMPLVSSARASR